MLKKRDIKEQQLKALDNAFQGVTDMVIMSPSGVNAILENKIRLDLRKKNIRLMLVKNTFARRTFEKKGFSVDGIWNGPTMLAWGGSSLADLSKELDTLFKKNDKVKFKGALIEGQQITFEQALKMPTRMEALSRVITLALSPAAKLVSQIKGPAAKVASQLKTIAEGEKAGEGDATA